MIPELGLRVVFAAVFGIVIGVERRWRGHAAGPHTHGLVAFGSAIFVLLSDQYGTSTDASRVVSQVVTGLGFLCGGVILRDGMRVRGLNTAATLWAVGAIGALSGSGSTAAAAMSTLALLVMNIVLHIAERRLPFLEHVDETQSGDRGSNGTA